MRDLDIDANPLRRVFVQSANTFSFGAIIPGAHPKGVEARLKITNSSKVRSTIEFAVNGDESADVFSVVPSKQEFPPHEHRFVTVRFHPKKIRSYVSRFEAKIVESEIKNFEGGEMLSFDILGRGTMPCISVVKPLGRDETGRVNLDFERLEAGKTKTREVLVRNDGVVPCMLRVSIVDVSSTNLSPRCSVFSMSNIQSGSTVSLEPGTSKSLEVRFDSTSPSEKPYIAELRLDVLQNRFDSETIVLRGESYRDNLGFEELPEENEGSELRFGSLHLKDEKEENQDEDQEEVVEKSVSFVLVNRVENLVRFEFPEHEHFLFSPRVGHLRAFGKLEIQATFRPGQEAISYVAESMPVKMKRIRLVEEEENESPWNDTMSRLVVVDENVDEQEGHCNINLV